MMAICDSMVINGPETNKAGMMNELMVPGYLWRVCFLPFIVRGSTSMHGKW